MVEPPLDAEPDWTPIFTAMARDETAKRRGVRCVTIHIQDWFRLGCPTYVPWGTYAPDSMEHVPIYPTGTEQGCFRWYYKSSVANNRP